jgi:hypothetical protein
MWCRTRFGPVGPNYSAKTTTTLEFLSHLSQMLDDVLISICVERREKSEAFQLLFSGRLLNQPISVEYFSHVSRCDQSERGSRGYSRLVIGGGRRTLILAARTQTETKNK